MEDKKWIFHFYALKWHKKKWENIWNIYKYNQEEKVSIYNTFKKANFFPSDDDNKRYKIHNPVFIETKSLIYGYFVQYYNEHIKTIENPNWKDVLTSEWYLFFYFIDDNRIVFQHKKWIWDKPGIGEIKKNFITYFSSLLYNNSLASPIWWDKEELWRERQEFIEIFFNKKNIITYLEAENFDKLLLESQKNEKWDLQFTYFNPILDEWDTALQTEDKQIENLKSLKAEANEGCTLWKVPACRIALASSNNPKKMKFIREWTYEEEIFVEKWTSNIEEVVDSDTSISQVYLENIINSILSFVRWRKAKIKGEDYNDKQSQIF